MSITDSFKNKTLVITGGTGSFGSTVLKHFLTSDIGEVPIINYSYQSMLEVSK